MWSRKRVLRKDRKQHAKKRILLVSLLCGTVGVVLVLVGSLVLSREPIFASPVPFLRSIGIGNDDEAKGTIEKFLKEHAISYSEVKQMGKTTYQVLDTSGSVIYLSSDKDLAKELSSLQRIVSRLTMEGKKYLRLDLRYDKPVIVLQ